MTPKLVGVLLRADYDSRSHEMTIRTKRGFNAFLLPAWVSDSWHVMCAICWKVSHESHVPLYTAAFGSHCVITAWCKGAGCAARKQRSLINPCWEKVSCYIATTEMPHLSYQFIAREMLTITLFSPSHSCEVFFCILSFLNCAVTFTKPCTSLLRDSDTQV